MIKKPELLVQKVEGFVDDEALHAHVLEDRDADIAFRKLMAKRAIEKGLTTAEAAKLFGIFIETPKEDRDEASANKKRQYFGGMRQKRAISRETSSDLKVVINKSGHGYRAVAIRVRQDGSVSRASGWGLTRDDARQLAISNLNLTNSVKHLSTLPTDRGLGGGTTLRPRNAHRLR